MVPALVACSLVIGELPEGVDGTASGGGTGGTAATGGTAGTACKADCDCDGDGALAEGGACGGNDCDDGDADAHLGQTAFFDVERKTAGGYDFDCSGGVEPEFTTALDCGLGVALCPPATQVGFIKPLPACGAPGNWGYCLKSGIDCTPQVIIPDKKMACH